MGLWNKIKGWWSNLWQKEAQRQFQVQTIAGDAMEAALKEWADIYRGKPAWADGDIESFNFAKKLCNETARLTTLALGISVEGSAKADWMQGIMDQYTARMTEVECEYACAFGYLIIKPNGEGLDYVKPYEFLPTSETDGKIDGGIFFDRYHETGDKWYYTRMEWHRFEDSGAGKNYRVSNKTFRSQSREVIGREIPMSATVWNWMEEDAVIINLEKPLFAVFRMPIANHIDVSSPLGCSVFCNAVKELKNLDIAHTRLGDEIFDSQKQVFLGDMMIVDEGRPVQNRIGAGGVLDKAGKKMPRYVRILPGSSSGEEYHEINPQLQTTERIEGINHFLNLVGIKCGYSAGQFVLDGRSGQVTATQVEADDRETIQMIKQIRDSFRSATDDLLYALDKYAELYNLAPLGMYEASYDFGDITYNWEEDRARHWQYVQAGKYPLWRYYVKFEGMSEEEAKEVVAEAKGENEERGLFGEE